jgi:Calx-beta domain/Beta-propeller repeat
MSDFIGRLANTGRARVRERFEQALKRNANFAHRLMAISATIAIAAMVFLGGARLNSPGQLRTNLKQAQQPTRQLVAKSWGNLPLTFEENRGQTNAAVQYLARGTDYVLFLTPQEAVLSLKGLSADTERSISLNAKPGSPRTQPSTRESSVRDVEARAAQDAILRISLSGGRKNATAVAEARQLGPINYFTGNDPAKWTTDVPHYGRVKYQDVYAGIDLLYYGNQQQLEYDFVVAPGADPSRIHLAIEGAQDAHVDESGNLVLNVAGHDVVQHKPVVYQTLNGSRVTIESRYSLVSSVSEDASIQVAFALGNYDRARELVIDPVLVYSTYLSAGQSGSVNELAVDSDGNLYVAGTTQSANFPVVGGLPTDEGGSAPPTGITGIFVSKLDPAGDTLLYSTYLSGNGDTYPFGLQVDSQGAVYLSGQTLATNFPAVGGLPQDQAGVPQGFLSTFVTKINPAGNALVYSTYLGANISANFGLALDSAGNAYVTGATYGSPFTFPIVGGLPVDQGGGEPLSADIAATYVAKLNATGDTLVYSTTLSANGSNDNGYAIVVDSLGQAYVGVWANTPNLPIVGGLSASQGGVPSSGNSIYLFALNAAGSSLLYSTYLDGTGDDVVHALSLDVSGNLYVAGETSSKNFPVVGGLTPDQGGHPGPGFPHSADGAFISKLNPAGNALVYSTYLSGNSLNNATAMVVDSLGSAYVTGETVSTNFPLISGLPGDQGGTQQAGPFGAETCTFVSKLDPTGSMLVFSTYLCNNDVPAAIARDGNGNIYVAGNIGNDGSSFPILGGLPPLDQGNAASVGGAFITKLTEDTPLLSFDGATFDAEQFNSPNQLTVVRAGAATDYGVTVDFNTGNGSAIAGTDYTAASGTLSWAAGDVTPKTITLNILPDPSGNELTFNVELTNANGATLGTPNITTITIHRNDEIFSDGFEGL